jgi:hypothetical protein
MRLGSRKVGRSCTQHLGGALYPRECVFRHPFTDGRPASISYDCIMRPWDAAARTCSVLLQLASAVFHASARMSLQSFVCAWQILAVAAMPLGGALTAVCTFGCLLGVRALRI